MNRLQVNLNPPGCPAAETSWGSFLLHSFDNTIQIPQQTIPIYWNHPITKEPSIRRSTGIRKQEGFGDRQTYLVTRGKFAGFLAYMYPNRDTHAHWLVRPLRSEARVGNALQQRLENEFNIRGDHWFARGMVTLLEKLEIPVQSGTFVRNCTLFSQAVRYERV